MKTASMQATTQNKMASRHTSSRATTGKPAAGRPRQSRRRLRCIAEAVGILLLGVGIFQLPVGSSGEEFTAGDPIELVVTAGDTLEIALEGSNTAGVGISFQQCTGNSYLRMYIMDNDTTLYPNANETKVTTNQCVRILAEEAITSDSDVSTDKLCAFRASSAVIQGYTKETVFVIDTAYITPTDLTVKLQNTGSASASGQLVFFTQDYNAPNVDDTIDRVNTIAELDENTYDVQVDFSATASNEESFCESGCALYAYYIEIKDEEDADLFFGTTCQAETGTRIYDTVITTESTATMANAAYQVTTCLQFPANIEATYRVILVVSTLTTSYARVGYGLEDQVIFASSELQVDADADVECPDEEEDDGDDGDDGDKSGAIRKIIPAGRATGAMALSLAVAAGRAAARGAEL